jgi:hypothetical protein
MTLNPEFIERLRAVAQEIDNTPFTILIWGPGVPADSNQGRKRERLKEHLKAVLGPGASVVFSEDAEAEFQELGLRGDIPAEYIQLRAADAVILIHESPGSIAEAAAYTDELRKKCIVFTNRRDRPGFAGRTIASLKIEYVEREEWVECNRVTKVAREYVEDLRVRKFMKVSKTSFDWEA